eukprot:26405-Pelagococcus_subviridis.AAC.3
MSRSTSRPSTSPASGSAAPAASAAAIRDVSFASCSATAATAPRRARNRRAMTSSWSIALRSSKYSSLTHAPTSACAVDASAAAAQAVGSARATASRIA